MAAVTIHSDFGAQEEEIYQDLYGFPFYLHGPVIMLYLNL